MANKQYFSAIVAALLLSALVGAVAMREWDSRQPLYGCVLIKGEKGQGGGGDAGDGLFCRNGFVIMPGTPGKDRSDG